MNRRVQIYLTALVVLGNLYGKVQAATLTICPSGCDYITFYAAESAAASGDFIRFDGPSTETLGASSSGALKNLTIYTNGSPQTININVDISEDIRGGTWTFDNLVFNHLTTVTTLFSDSAGASPMTFNNCGFSSTQADALIGVSGGLSPLVFNQCALKGGASSTAGVSIGSATSYVIMQNCLVTDVGLGYGLNETNHKSVTPDLLSYCDFVNNQGGANFYSNSADAVTNCIFTSTGSTEITTTGSSTVHTTLDYCAFKTTPSTAGPPYITLGTHNQVSTAAAEFVNATAGSEDLHLLSTALSK